ncbi:MAG TPA: penicillin-binding protein activator [Desulfotignum sp.]|nr:penicillin-binding protein activator [Desulfotignum sp.]
MTVNRVLIFRSTALLAAVFFLAAVWGCAPRTVQKPKDGISVTQPQVPDLDDKEKQTAALVKMLGAEAKKFMEQGDLKQAFLTYNQAMAQKPDDPQKNKMLSGIEQVLAKADPPLIKQFLDTRNLAVPEALLLYWLGVNHAAAREYADALAVLTRFADTFPDHAHAADAKELIALIKQTTFKKDTIGCLLPLSGKYAIFGQKALKGIQMAIQDLSHTYDRNFKIIVKDTRSDPQKAADCVDELDQAHVMGIIGPLLAVETAGARAQELQIPLIALTQKADFPQTGDYLFSNFITPQMQVQTLAAYVFRKLGLSKVAVLYPDERYGRLHMQLFREVVEEYGGQMVAAAAYDGKKTDFSIPIQKLVEESFLISEPDLLLPQSDHESPNQKTGDPRDMGSDMTDKIPLNIQALFVPDSAARINMILPQLAFNDVKDIVLLGTNLWHEQSLLAETKGYNRRTVITEGYFGKSQKPATGRFEKAFTALYKESPGFIEAVSYDTAQILFKTGMDAFVDSRQLLRDALAQGRLFEGVTGNTIFDTTGAARKEIFLITIKNNQFTEIQP